jgi:hypothetical protein
MAAMNDAFTAVTASALIFSGVMSTAKFNDDGQKGTLMIEAENELADLMYPNLVRFTQNHQQRIFPTDTGLRFISTIGIRKIWWGRYQNIGGSGGGPDSPPPGGVPIGGGGPGGNIGIIDGGSINPIFVPPPVVQPPGDPIGEH